MMGLDGEVLFDELSGFFVEKTATQASDKRRLQTLMAQGRNEVSLICTR
jgi:hypothetical protein